MVKRLFTETISSKELPIFSLRENYLMTHNNKGMSYEMQNFSQTMQNKMRADNLHLMRGMTMTDGIEVPQLEAYNGSVNFEMLVYKRNKLITTTTKNYAIHFFMDDYLLTRIWNKIEKVTYTLMKLNNIVFSPDFSLYVDAPKSINIYNILRSRLVGAYWQMNGLSVIPTASWGNADSFKYCFNGLPKKSVIAVCGIGHNHCQSAKELWNMAIYALEKQKSPTKIIVYGGNNPDIKKFHTPIIYHEDFINKRLRKL